MTFATILAVVSGLTLAAAQALSHDLFRHVWKAGRVSEGTEIRVSQVATAAIGLAAIGAGLLFQHQNIGFLATLPLVIAASAAFPVLVLALYWRGLTARGAIAGGLTGLALSVLLMVLSPKVWVGAMGFAAAPFPYDYPTLISLPAAFAAAGLVSCVQRAAERRSP